MFCELILMCFLLVLFKQIYDMHWFVLRPFNNSTHDGIINLFH